MSHNFETGNATPQVAILLGSFNGQQYLDVQLDSISAQSYANWRMWASDDGSSDGTLWIFQRHQTLWGRERLTVLNGPRQGFSVNFLSMVCNTEVSADFFAYSDQDDIWEPSKLERAVSWLVSVPPDVPALYCARTRLVDEFGSDIGLSPLFRKAPSFSNAIIQSIAGGNTMVFNQAARKLLQTAGQNIGVVTHDWWTYIAVTACGGQVFYDSEPSLQYRQHSGNLVGMNSSWAARWKRICMLWRGDFRDWNDGHIYALQALRPSMSIDSLATLDKFASMRKRGVVSRIWGLVNAGLYRQTSFGDIGLILASIFKKL